MKDLGITLEKRSYTIHQLKCELHFLDVKNPSDIASQEIYEECFREILDREQPDFALSHYTDYFSSCAALKWDPKRSYIVISDNEFPRASVLRNFPSIGATYLRMRNVLVPSRFLRAVVRKELPWVKAYKLLNIIDLLQQRTPKQNPKYWLFVNPVREKGVEFVRELAERLPQEKFVWVTYWGAETPQHVPPNVSVLPRQKDLHEVLSKAKGVLVPSVWQEGFGRVPLEAMAAGVPVIASNRGNLPETLGEGGLCLSLDIELWIKAMKQMPRYRTSLRTVGFHRVKDYQREVDLSYRALWRAMTLKARSTPSLLVRRGV